MNGPLQRTRTIPFNQGNYNETKNPGNQGGSGPSTDNAPVGNKHPRFESVSEEEQETFAKQGKQEPLMLPIEHYLTVIGMLNRFKTKTTVWFDSQDAEKKRDSSRLVQFRLRGNKVTAVYEDESTRDVLATEIDVASRFASIFNASEAARLYELTDSGVPLHDAVLKVINESQGETGSGDDVPSSMPQRTMSVGGN
jgi:hypothetical protein